LPFGRELKGPEFFVSQTFEMFHQMRCSGSNHIMISAWLTKFEIPEASFFV